MKNNLLWRSIYYYEELDTDGSLISHECTQEASYKNGYLVKHFYDDGSNRTESITFVPEVKDAKQ